MHTIIYCELMICSFHALQKMRKHYDHVMVIEVSKNKNICIEQINCARYHFSFFTVILEDLDTPHVIR